MAYQKHNLLTNFFLLEPDVSRWLFMLSIILAELALTLSVQMLLLIRDSSDVFVIQ